METSHFSKEAVRSLPWTFILKERLDPLESEETPFPYFFVFFVMVLVIMLHRTTLIGSTSTIDYHAATRPRTVLIPTLYFDAEVELFIFISDDPNAKCPMCEQGYFWLSTSALETRAEANTSAAKLSEPPVPLSPCPEMPGVPGADNPERTTWRLSGIPAEGIENDFEEGFNEDVITFYGDRDEKGKDQSFVGIERGVHTDQPWEVFEEKQGNEEAIEKGAEDYNDAETETHSSFTQLESDLASPPPMKKKKTRRAGKRFRQHRQAGRCRAETERGAAVASSSGEKW